MIYRGAFLIRNLTANDPLSVDALLNRSCAPDLILCLAHTASAFVSLCARSLDNFPADQELQQLGTEILRRVYIRAREMTMTLGQ